MKDYGGSSYVLRPDVLQTDDRTELNERLAS